MSTITNISQTNIQSDITVYVYTENHRYVYFHVKKNIAQQVQILFRKGFSDKIWSVLKLLEHGKVDLNTTEKFIGKTQIKGKE